VARDCPDCEGGRRRGGRRCPTCDGTGKLPDGAVPLSAIELSAADREQMLTVWKAHVRRVMEQEGYRRKVIEKVMDTARLEDVGDTVMAKAEMPQSLALYLETMQRIGARV